MALRNNRRSRSRQTQACKNKSYSLVNATWK